jgi:hypothetical protein
LPQVGDLCLPLPGSGRRSCLRLGDLLLQALPIEQHAVKAQAQRLQLRLLCLHLATQLGVPPPLGCQLALQQADLHRLVRPSQTPASRALTVDAQRCGQLPRQLSRGQPWQLLGWTGGCRRGCSQQLRPTTRFQQVPWQLLRSLLKPRTWLLHLLQGLIPRDCQPRSQFGGSSSGAGGTCSWHVHGFAGA